MSCKSNSPGARVDDLLFELSIWACAAGYVGLRDPHAVGDGEHLRAAAQLAAHSSDAADATTAAAGVGVAAARPGVGVARRLSLAGRAPGVAVVPGRLCAATATGAATAIAENRSENRLCFRLIEFLSDLSPNTVRHGRVRWRAASARRSATAQSLRLLIKSRLLQTGRGPAGRRSRSGDFNIRQLCLATLSAVVARARLQARFQLTR